MKKIGILLDHYSSRADIRDFLPLICESENVVIFCTKDDYINIDAEIRLITPRKTLKNMIVDFLRPFIVKTFSNKNDTINWQLRKLNDKLGVKQYIKICYLYIISALPKMISIDSIVSLYDVNQLDLTDIDNFLLFSDVKYPCLLSRLKKENIKSSIYIYSWDHPSKMLYAPTQSFNYLVWNKGLKEDLEQLHKIPPASISIVGSTQLCYLNDYLKSNKSRSKIESDYIYFAASCGRISMIKQELSFLITLSKELKTSHPYCKILFRPYPNVADVSVYDEVKCHENIIFDDYMNGGDYTLEKRGFIDKYTNISNSLAVIHTGSTFGLESTYFQVPTFVYTFKDEVSSDISFHLRCSNAMKQHHIQKYLIASHSNVINSKAQLKGILNKVFSGEGDLLNYNKKVSEHTELASLSDITKRIILSFNSES